MSYQKLVRDKIPEIIKQNNEEPITRTLREEEYKKELEKKLQEELEEVLAAKGSERLEELADMLEVMISIGKLEGNTLKDIIEKAEEKRKKRGGFEKRIYLEGVKK